MTAAAPPDGAGPVRDEDAFDIERVAGWLRENATDTTGLAGLPTVGQFGGGASNLTYLLRYAASPTFPSGRDLVLRRPPVGTKAKGAHDMRREHDLQQQRTYEPAARDPHRRSSVSAPAFWNVTMRKNRPVTNGTTRP